MLTSADVMAQQATWVCFCRQRQPTETALTTKRKTVTQLLCRSSYLPCFTCPFYGCIYGWNNNTRSRRRRMKNPRRTLPPPTISESLSKRSVPLLSPKWAEAAAKVPTSQVFFVKEQERQQLRKEMSVSAVFLLLPFSFRGRTSCSH